MKKILIFLLFLLPWFIGGILFRYNPEFYNSLDIPSIALPGKIISIIWIIMYILIAIGIYKTYNVNKFKEKDYNYTLITNYLSNMLFPLFFFKLQSPFLGFVITLIVFISSIYLYLETKRIKKNASYYLIPYIIYTFYASILSFFIFVMNS